MIRRREFIAGLGSAEAWPMVARAQQSAMPVVGFLFAREDTNGTAATAFKKGLSEIGFIEGRNVVIEYRIAGGRTDRLPQMAADLVRRRVALIATTGGAEAVFAARAATTTIPVVFGMTADPVEAGVVGGLSRPGGNLTGLSFMSSELLPRRLELLHELVPAARRIAVLVNSNAPLTEEAIKAVKAGASSLGLEINVFDARNENDVDAAFASLVEMRAEGLLVNTSPLFTNLRVQLAILAARHAVPTVYSNRLYAESGGLMSYGTNLLDQYRQLGLYAGRILKGEKPSEMPVMQPTSFELVINLKTAKALGLTIPETLLATADEVIQ